MKDRDRLVNLALLVASTIFALLLGEAALRLMGRAPMYVSPERDNFWRYDSVLGWAHQAGQEGIFETRQFRTFVRINQRGLRDREHAYERPNGARRILVLGDSFAWGYGVEESERFSQRLQTLRDVEVINAGVSGYSTDQELLWLRDEGIKYDVDLVILVFSGNDIGDNNRQLVHTIYYKPQFVREEDHLILEGSPVPRASFQARLIYSLSQRSSLAFFLVQRYFDFLTAYNSLKTNSDGGPSSLSGSSPSEMGSAGEPFSLTIALINEMRNIAISKDANFMIVATDHWWNSPSRETYKDFIDALQAEGFSVLDVESMPGFDPGAMLIPDDGHWNRSGHEFVTERITDLIEAKQLLSQPQN